MSAANRKFQQLGRQVHAWKANDAQRTKDKKMNIFPHCRGTFDNCPTEEELNSMVKEKKAPRICGQCPAFQEKPPKNITVDSRPRMSAEDLEFYKKMMAKKNKDEPQP